LKRREKGLEERTAKVDGGSSRGDGRVINNRVLVNIEKYSMGSSSETGF